MAETGRYTSATCTTVPSYTLQDDQGNPLCFLEVCHPEPLPPTPVHLGGLWILSGQKESRGDREAAGNGAARSSESEFKPLNSTHISSKLSLL